MPGRIIGVTKRLLAAARAEFSESGFEKASIRRIAARAETSPRAVYTRFANKASLFEAVVEPAAEGFLAMYREERRQYWERAEARDSSVPPEQIYCRCVEYAYGFSEEFRLLLTEARGTRYEGFCERLAEEEVRGVEEHVPRLIGRPAGAQYDCATRLFVEKITHAFFSNLFAPLLEGMDRQTAACYVVKLTRFYSTGLAMGDGYGLM